MAFCKRVQLQNAILQSGQLQHGHAATTHQLLDRCGFGEFVAGIAFKDQLVTSAMFDEPITD